MALYDSIIVSFSSSLLSVIVRVPLLGQTFLIHRHGSNLDLSLVMGLKENVIANNFFAAEYFILLQSFQCLLYTILNFLRSRSFLSLTASLLDFISTTAPLPSFKEPQSNLEVSFFFSMWCYLCIITFSNTNSIAFMW